MPAGWIALNSRHVRARFSNITTSASAPIPASTLHIRCTLLCSLLSPHAHHCAPSAPRRPLNPHHLSSCPDPPHPMRLFLLQRQILPRLVAPDLSLHCPRHLRQRPRPFIFLGRHWHYLLWCWMERSRAQHEQPEVVGASVNSPCFIMLPHTFLQDERISDHSLRVAGAHPQALLPLPHPPTPTRPFPSILSQSSFPTRLLSLARLSTLLAVSQPLQQHVPRCDGF